MTQSLLPVTGVFAFFLGATILLTAVQALFVTRRRAAVLMLTLSAVMLLFGLIAATGVEHAPYTAGARDVAAVMAAAGAVVLGMWLNRRHLRPWYEMDYYFEQQLVDRLLALLKTAAEGSMSTEMAESQLYDCGERAGGLADDTPRGKRFAELAKALHAESSRFRDLQHWPEDGIRIRHEVCEVLYVGADGTVRVMIRVESSRDVVVEQTLDREQCPPKACVPGGAFHTLGGPDGWICFLAPSEAADREFLREIDLTLDRVNRSARKRQPAEASTDGFDWIRRANEDEMWKGSSGR